MDKDIDIFDEEWEQKLATIQEEREIRSALNRMDVEAPDAEMAWKTLSDKLNLDEPKPAVEQHVSMSILLKSIISAAAIVLVAFLITHNIGDKKISDGNSSFGEVAQNAGVATKDSTCNSVKAKSTTIAMASEVDDVEMQSLETGRGESKQIVLSDGTKVWLNAESTLLYPNRFTGNERRVQLTGEAYFEVKHNQRRPFKVETASLVATDLGTAFDLKAYIGRTTQLVLVSGKVAVQKRGEDATSVTMEPDQVLTLESGKMTVSSEDTYPLVQWKNGLFYFHHTALVDVMKEIGRWYHINVVFENKASLYTQIHFVAERKSTLDDVISQLNGIEGVNVAKLDNEISVR